jgi:hypothetical protein
MIGKLTKYAPIAALLGYAAVYSSKGWQNVTKDLQAFAADPIGKLQAKWQNIAIAVVAGIAIGFIKKSGLPREIKVILLLIAYAIIGYEIALTIDPPYGNGNGYGMVSPSANRYANGGS